MAAPTSVVITYDSTSGLWYWLDSNSVQGPLESNNAAYRSAQRAYPDLTPTFGAGPAPRVRISSVATQPSAYTQTYSTASRTVPNLTSAAVGTTGATNTSPYGFTSALQADSIPTAINALRDDVTALAKVINSVIDDLETWGEVAQ